MSGALLPIIEQLAKAPSHADRADWLKRCPITILGKYDLTIRNRLEIAGFGSACDYLDAVQAVRHAVRDASGQFRPEVHDLLREAGLILHARAEALDPLQTSADHDAP